MPAYGKFLHRGNLGEALPDQRLELARRIVVESVDEMLIGRCRTAQSMELNEPSPRMGFRETGAARIVS